MATTFTNPFADPDTEAPQREAEDKPSPFLTAEDLMGRHMIIVVKKIEEKQGERGKFESATCDIIVLDGRKTEKIPTLPRIEFNKFLGGYKVIPELRMFLPDSADPERAGKPCLAYFTIKDKAHFLELPEEGLREKKETIAAWQDYLAEVSDNPPF